jgi:hypothetical protein
MKGRQRRAVRGVPTSVRGLRLNHIFFTDDSLLFCKVDIKHWNGLANLLNKYESASGQRLNISKTAIFFSRNTPPELKEKV